MKVVSFSGNPREKKSWLSGVGGRMRSPIKEKHHVPFKQEVERMKGMGYRMSLSDCNGLRWVKGMIN